MARLDRRRFLRTAAAGTALAAATTATAPLLGTTAATAGRRRRDRRGATATLRWLGTAGWRVEIGDRTLLVDPYLSRFPTGLFTGAFDPLTRLTVDTARIDPHVGGAETVLVTHSHWDHFNDVPYIAGVTGARVLGTMTTYQLGRAAGVPTGQLAPVKGGEVLDFGDYRVEVIASGHSRNSGYSMFAPGVRLSEPSPPTTIADLPEGDTLAFQLTVVDGPSVFFMGASDFVARNLRGLAPDVAMVALPASDATFDYVPRLLRALNRPSTVVPVHWDDFEVPLQNPPSPGGEDARRRLAALVESVQAVAPGTEILIPDYLTPYEFS